MSDPHAHAAPARCENCATALQGPWCHVCGQHGHNPLRSVAHALEEVFESFWHVDGRIVRTLRDLCVPGRLAANFLAGHRVRYLPPLRLFLILTVLTFFVGKLVLHFDPGNAIRIDAGDADARKGAVVSDGGDDEAVDPAFAAAKTVDEVLQARVRKQRELAQARNDPDAGWMVSAIGDIAREHIDDQARDRMRALGATPAQLRTLDTPVETPAAAAEGAAPTDARANGSPASGAHAAGEGGLLQRWLAHRADRLKQNALRVKDSPDEFFRLVLGAVPGALFLLVPLFALCLRLLYLRSPFGYLEHLVVAFYSHAFMLLMLLADFVLIGLGGLPGVPVPLGGALAALGSVLVFLVAPLYLLWTQKRVYAQGWFITLAKYAMLGTVYTVLLSLVLVYAVLAGMSS
ncbi:MAG: DUF3667 domain-containing protein [Xanthomonadales bacterium]|nr:DUF3667 domain-containing protein [Xanthomonadales bacterium]